MVQANHGGEEGCSCLSFLGRGEKKTLSSSAYQEGEKTLSPVEMKEGTKKPLRKAYPGTQKGGSRLKNLSGTKEKQTTL